ncbi:MAG TPA: hypothetical protein VJX67_03200 [Blastocatellia bacterium]|nr:hypothetical protein [Blastocatellia bacterium]
MRNKGPAPKSFIRLAKTGLIYAAMVLAPAAAIGFGVHNRSTTTTGASTPLRRPTTLAGQWLLEKGPADGVAHLALQRTADGWSNFMTSFDVPLARLDGLVLPREGRKGEVRFLLSREAGAVTFQGELKNGAGSGQFQFSPNLAFVAAISAFGYVDLPLEKLFSMAVHGVTTAFVGEVKGLGYDHPEMDQLIAMRIHEVTPKYIRALADLGYQHPPIDELIAARIQGVNRKYIEGLNSLGYTAIPVETLVAMRTGNVDLDFIQRLKELGFDLPSPERLVAMKVQGVDTQFLKDLAGLGYSRISADDMVAMKIHGVTIDFIRSLRSAGYQQIPAGELVAMKIHGVTIDCINRMKSRVMNPSVNQLINLCSQGMG